jgi:hypothetical protein
MEKFVLAKRPNSIMVPSLPDASERIQSPENPSLPQSGQDRSLIDARDDFRRVLHPDGEVDGQEDYLDRSKQFQLVEAEARRLGFLFDHLEPLVEGGREHDLIFDDASGTVLKFTKPSSAAYVVGFLEESRVS